MPNHQPITKPARMVTRSPSKFVAGFTIVELLIVIVVIGILAAITIVAYNGIVQKAVTASLVSDLSQSAGVLAIDQVDSGSYPDTKELANGGQGLKASSGTSYQYTAVNSNPPSFCLTATNGMTAYNITNLTRPTSGVCPGHTAPSSVVSLIPNTAVVTTLAGTSAGYTDGSGTSAQFNSPKGLAVAPDGTVYVADSSNQRIRKITAGGVVSSLAGAGPDWMGRGGFAEGTGASAQFNDPSGVAVAADGTVYVADRSNQRIRKITAGGVVTTLAGANYGYADGSGASAQFGYPSDLAIDSAGNLFVADNTNNRIRKVTPAGVVTTVAGSGIAGTADGTGASAQFSQPQGIAVDSIGTIYVVDANNYRVRKVTPAGVVTTLAGSTFGFADGTGASAQFFSPQGLAVDSAGTLYLADTSNQRIRKITPAGVVTTVAGSGVAGSGDGTGSSAQFYQPQGIAVDASGALYVSDQGNHHIRKIR